MSEEMQDTQETVESTAATEEKEAATAENKEASAAANNTDSADNVLQKKKGKMPVVIVGIALAIVLILVLVLTSAPVRRKIAMGLGERYLSELKYEQALAQYQAALDIDAKRGDSSEDINDKLKEVVAAAEEKIEEELYVDAIDILEPVTNLSTADDQVVYTISYSWELKSEAEEVVRAYELLDEANKAFEAGEYEKAIDLYDQVVKILNDEDIVQPRRNLAAAYKELIELWNAKDYDSLMTFMDYRMDAVIDQLQVENPQHVICRNGDKDLFVVLDQDVIYIKEGKDTPDESGKATALISCVNCNAIYTGDWKDGIPDGDGEVVIGLKRNNSSISNGVKYSGNFSGGIAAGGMKYSDNELTDIPFNVSQGKLQIFKVDDKDRLWVADKVGDNYYIYRKLKSWIDEKVVGVPGFGGVEESFAIEQRRFDDKPPVFIYDTFVGDTGFDYSKDVRAEDDVDGVVSVKCDKNYDKNKGKITYSFTATDNEGNTAYLKIVEKVTTYWEDVFDDWGCGMELRERYTVESIKEE